MGEKEWESADLFDLIGDSLARRILVVASERPVSAQELSDQFDVSTPTVYRRVNALLDYDLVTERHQVDGDGNHYKTFETTLRRVSFEIDDGGVTIDVQMRRSLVDQFQSFWSDLEQSQPRRALDAGGPVEDDPAREGSPHG